MRSATHADAFLRRRFGARAGGTTLLANGFWSTAYAFELDGREMVVRFGRGRRNYERDRLAGTFSGPSLPVPAIVEIGGTPGGRHYAISPRHHGRFLEDVDPVESPWLGDALWRLFDAMRAVEPPAAGRDRAGRAGTLASSWRAWLTAPWPACGPRAERWRERLAGSEDLADVVAGARRAVAAIAGSGACPEVRHVFHGDLLNHNVLVDEEAQTVSAVLDWGAMGYGDFLFDVAWLEFYAPWYPTIAALDLPSSAARHFSSLGMDVPGLAARLHCYEIKVGLDRLRAALTSSWWPLPDPPSDAGPGVLSLAEVVERTRELVVAGVPA